MTTETVLKVTRRQADGSYTVRVTVNCPANTDLLAITAALQQATAFFFVETSQVFSRRIHYVVPQVPLLTCEEAEALLKNDHVKNGRLDDNHHDPDKVEHLYYNRIE